MVSLDDYKGREQAYVKHMFLELYLEALVHKTASIYPHIAYVDGFAGPWQSANEQFQDTSFGIALNALSKAKASWQPKRVVRMSAYLVEQNPAAYAKLARVAEKFSDVEVKTYPGNFLDQLPIIARDIPHDAFTFFFIDPKGWRIPLSRIAPYIKRQNAEVVFNFMFEFINRFANMKDPVISQGIDELIPFGDFRAKLAATAGQEKGDGSVIEGRKELIVDAFNESLAKLGNYRYVADVTVLRPLKDRPLYCLCYATRHPQGIEVFRDCQIKALLEQAKTRAASKMRSAQTSSGQAELFQSLHELAPDESAELIEKEKAEARAALIELTPQPPGSIVYGELRTRVLTRHIVRASEVNQIAVKLRKEGLLRFIDWDPGKKVPQPEYRVQRGEGPEDLFGFDQRRTSV